MQEGLFGGWEERHEPFLPDFPLDACLDVHTDGACLVNPGGVGGWGVIFCTNPEQVLWGNVEATTSNRMELTAALEALRAVKPNQVLRVHSDSTYVVKGMTVWIKAWRKKGFRRPGPGGVVAMPNADLWRQLDELAASRRVSWKWVRGHAGHKFNERVDTIAREAARCLEQDLEQDLREEVQKRLRNKAQSKL